MLLAVLLAQAVLPSPSAGPIQPPGVICVGDCSEVPMVWRAKADRGRLVVACDMRSDTCSDGRKITTVRATPVPCETSPGVWEIIPADQGCYSVRGLESWAQTTSYLSHGGELNLAPWEPINGSTVEVLPDGYRIHPAAGQVNSGLTQAGLVAIPAGGESRTLACIVRTHQPAYLRYWVTSSQSVSFPAVDTGGRWEVVAGTREVAEGSSTTIRVGNGPATESPIPFDVKACWLTRTSTPGRPCWGGEAPVTCAANRHTISTEGWPTEAGEIEITFTAGPSSNSRHLFDSRTSGVTPTYGVGMYLTPTDGLVAIYCAGDCSNRNKSAITLLPVNHVRYKWSDSLAQVWLNGEEVLSWEPSVVIESHSETASLGSHGSSNSNHLNGSIYSLRIRSFE